MALHRKEHGEGKRRSKRKIRRKAQRVLGAVAPEDFDQVRQPGEQTLSRKRVS